MKILSRINLNNSQKIQYLLSRTKNIESAFAIKNETKYLFFGFIITVAVAIVFIHIILFITDSDKYIGTTSAVLLGSSTCISLFIVLSNHRKIEVQKFKLVFIGVTLWFLGESTYSFYQIVLDTTNRKIHQGTRELLL